MKKTVSRVGLILSVVMIFALLFSTVAWAAEPGTTGTTCPSAIRSQTIAKLCNAGTTCSSTVNFQPTATSQSTSQLQTWLSKNLGKTNWWTWLESLGKKTTPLTGTGSDSKTGPGTSTGSNSNTGTNPAPVSGLTADEQHMVDLVNQERTSRGLKPLTVDMKLVKTARMKSQDMIDKGYFGHNSPTYGSPFDLMKSQGITYRYAGENLAGNSTVDAAHNGLMNSQGHRENILNPNYTHIGIGIINEGPYGKMFTQHFIG